MTEDLTETTSLLDYLLFRTIYTTYIHVSLIYDGYKD